MSSLKNPRLQSGSINERLNNVDYYALCYKILRRDGWRCRNCEYRNNLHVHHCIYRSQGGPDESWNLLTLCAQCHDAVHVIVRNGEHALELKRPPNPTQEDEWWFIRATWWRPGQ